MAVVRGIVGLFFRKSAETSNVVFWLHYRFTAVLLLIFGAISYVELYLEKPIECNVADDIPTEVVESYCFTTSTFSIADAFNKKVGIEVPYPGITKFKPNQEKVIHNYYQYVCFMMLLQSVLFYLPRFIWKYLEKGRIQNMLRYLDGEYLTEDQRQMGRQQWARYLASDNLDKFLYLAIYVILELANFINVIVQIIITDKFLNGQFGNYGHRVVSGSSESNDSPGAQIEIFPRLSKCSFYRYGSSGDVQRFDALCVLKINHLIDKMYLCLWFWFILLAIISALAVIYRVAQVLLPPVRYMILSFRSRLSSNRQLNAVAQHCKFGDWLMVNLLSKNMEPIHFADFINVLADHLSGKGANDFKMLEPHTNDV